MSKTMLEFKVKARKEQSVSIEEAIRTAQFIRNKCIRLWMEGRGISQYDLSAYCKVLAKEFKFAGELNANPPYPPSEEGGQTCFASFLARQASADRAWSSISRFYDNCKKQIPGQKGYPALREGKGKGKGKGKKIPNPFPFPIPLPLWVRLVRRADGYYCQFIVAVEVKVDVDPTKQAVGIDVGLKEFYTDSNSHTEPNPRFYRKGEKKLKLLQRRLSRKYDKKRRARGERQSNNYHKARNRLARLLLLISRQREEHAKRLARCVISSNDVVVYEDLKVRNLVKNHCLAKSIQDAGWYQRGKGKGKGKG